ncbi:MAG: PAS domain S-box protein [Nitrospiraceae bacterium]|nr:PAS domain S-box protein [Nitrospirota bacterium]MDA8338049.1 PAS domain S-box protein [Nitrospiraceae bacterium]
MIAENIKSLFISGRRFAFQLVVSLLLVFLMANLGAIVDSFAHPDIPYFDEEHLIVGFFAGLVTAILLVIVTIYLNKREKVLQDLKMAYKEIERSQKSLVESQEEISRSEERFRLLTESTLTGVYLIQDNLFRYVNPALASIFGYRVEELIDKLGPMDLTSPEDRNLVAGNIRKRIEGGVRDIRYSFKGLRKDGTLIDVEVHGAKVEYNGKPAVIGTLLDITERKKLEDQLRHAQKMEAVGQLAGGIAHDFNNMLNAIIGFGSLMQMDMKEDDPNRIHLKEILNAGERAAHLTRSLLAFSRKQIIDLKPQDLNEIIKGVEKFLRRIIGEDIELKTALSDKDLKVLIDRGQIEQVLMNLATNARDAMPDGGELIMETEITQMDDEYIKRHGYGESGMYALLSVTDSGIGMDEKTRQRIFEPFFTTKELGRGTGLGLAMVYGIVKQHDGYINVYSEPQKGTTFKIYLPLIRSEVEETVSAMPAAYPEGGTETVLVAGGAERDNHHEGKESVCPHRRCPCPDRNRDNQAVSAHRGLSEQTVKH